MSTPPPDSTSNQTEPPLGAADGDIAARIKRLEREEPLRARILGLLAGRPAIPSVLADRLGARNESVSRLLKELREERLVRVEPVSGDRRQRRYILTGLGLAELRRHHSYGDPGPPPVEPEREEMTRFLYSSLQRSVKMRRQDNLLEEAARRQRRILNQAHKLNEGELVLEAIHELATTLRQQHEEDEVAVLLDELQEVALGRTRYEDAGLSLQASAHRSYALGRRDESKANDQSARMSQLITATTNYCELAQGSPAGGSRKWRERQAWSAYSLAANMRSLSRLDDSLRIAVSARKLFEEIEDSYGTSHCLFLIGFCLRMLGDFDEAWNWLSDANSLARQDGYKRLQVDSTMQIGEVHRCRGELSEAQEHLEEARSRAEEMDLLVTQAFAHSALGSVLFGQGRWLDAQRELQQAKERFDLAPHWEGLALNARRLAIAARFVFEETPDGDLKIAEALNEEAKNRYLDPNRPAGVVACSIEHDRLRMCVGRPPDAIDNLLDLIENKQSERISLLELDPWVPSMLVKYAEETENETLVDQSRSLLAVAHEKRRQALRKAKEIIGGTDVADAVDDPHMGGVAEMGGEARLEGSLEGSPLLAVA